MFFTFSVLLKKIKRKEIILTLYNQQVLSFGEKWEAYEIYSLHVTWSLANPEDVGVFIIIFYYNHANFIFLSVF